MEGNLYSMWPQVNIPIKNATFVNKLSTKAIFLVLLPSNKAYVSGQIIVRISHAWLMAHLEQIFQLSTNKLQPNCCMPEISIALTTLAREIKIFC